MLVGVSRPVQRVYGRGEKPVTYRLILPEKFSGSTRSATPGVGRVSIQCLVCGLTSYNPNEVAHRYCPSCNVFHEERPRDDEPHPAADLTISRTWQSLMQRRMEAYRDRLQMLPEADRTRAEHLASMLEAFVPLKIHDLAVKGGPDDADLEWAAEYGKSLGFSATSLLWHIEDSPATEARAEAELGSKKMTAGLIRAFAILAFFPGGVCTLGVYFDTGAPDATRVRRTHDMHGVLPATKVLLEELWSEKAEAAAQAKQSFAGVDTSSTPTHWFEFDGNPNRYFGVLCGQLGDSARVRVCQDTVTPSGRIWKTGTILIISPKRLHPVDEVTA
jgi:hypothetical protein